MFNVIIQNGDVSDEKLTELELYPNGVLFQIQGRGEVVRVERKNV
jgi:hypothetical protein